MSFNPDLNEQVKKSFSPVKLVMSSIRLSFVKIKLLS